MKTKMQKLRPYFETVREINQMLDGEWTGTWS